MRYWWCTSTSSTNWVRWWSWYYYYWYYIFLIGCLCGEIHCTPPVNPFVNQRAVVPTPLQQSTLTSYFFSRPPRPCFVHSPFGFLFLYQKGFDAIKKNRQHVLVPVHRNLSSSNNNFCRRNYCKLGVGVQEGICLREMDGKGLKVGIAKALWNVQITDPLVKGVYKGLEGNSVLRDDITVVEVPGAFELPMTTKWLCNSGKFDVVVAIGCLIKGETMHFEYISEAVAHGLMKVQLSCDVPVIFGVLTVMNDQQARDRVNEDANHGVSWGETAVRMGVLRRAAMGESKKCFSSSLGFQPSSQRS